MKGVVTAILGGGQGTRLWPLTRDRAKPAVPIGGKFRLIDIPISNSLHAGIDRVYVMTQFNTASLHRHIAQTYRFDAFSQGFVHILAAEQSLDNRDWYQGTADAVRQNMRRLQSGKPRPQDILILSGDQLYLMDVAGFVTSHRERDADFSVAVKPVTAEEAHGLGVMRLDRSGRIVEFVEKPQDPETIARFTLDRATVDSLGLDAEPGMLLASMGIYIFRSAALAELLDGNQDDDFGREVIPAALDSHRGFGFLHNGYWRDIGTIGSFHEANVELTLPMPELNLYSPDRPIYTHPRFLPGCKLSDCQVSQSILADGGIIAGSRVARSIIGIRSLIRAGSVIESSVVMGATAYEHRKEATVPLGIGRDCHIRGAIVDLDSRIGDDCRLINEAGVDHADGDGYSIRDGVIVVHRGATIAPGTTV
ncbi:MAG: sugar phosphate nucleotidyltransferase [Acidobacteriota bacterium]